MQEDAERKTKERIAGQQGKFRELKEALDKVIKILNKDAEVIILLHKHMICVQNFIEHAQLYVMIPTSTYIQTVSYVLRTYIYTKLAMYNITVVAKFGKNGRKSWISGNIQLCM